MHFQVSDETNAVDFIWFMCFMASFRGVQLISVTGATALGGFLSTCCVFHKFYHVQHHQIRIRNRYELIDIHKMDAR